MSHTVADLVEKVRSKNAGPYWLTIDLFCANRSNYEKLRSGLSTAQVAQALDQAESAITRFDIDALNVIKFSLPRPVVQGHRSDRDMHGAQWSILIENLPLA